MSDGAEFPSWRHAEYCMEDHHDASDGVECGQGADGGEPPGSGGVDEGEGKKRLANAVVQNLEHQHGNLEPAQCTFLIKIPEIKM